MKYIYRLHALQRMFTRDIDEKQIQNMIEHGEIIKKYLDDKPYPSFLVLGIVENIALHIV